MTHHQPLLTPEQQGWEASRAHATSELLHQGASFDELGRLVVDARLSDTLREKYVAIPTREEFIKTTLEGRVVGDHRELLLALQNEFHGMIGNANLFKPEILESSFRNRYSHFISSNKIDIDLDKVEQDQEDNTLDERPYIEKSMEVVDNCLTNLNTLIDRLAQRPDLRIGRTVKVVRTPKNDQSEGTIEDNWEVTGLLATGNVTVRRDVTMTDPNYTKPGQYITKSVPITTLESWNPLQ